MFEGRIETIEIKGDHATARLVVTLAGRERREPIGFEKVNGRWLIDLVQPGRE